MVGSYGVAVSYKRGTSVRLSGWVYDNLAVVSAYGDDQGLHAMKDTSFQNTYRGTLIIRKHLHTHRWRSARTVSTWVLWWRVNPPYSGIQASFEKSTCPGRIDFRPSVIYFGSRYTPAHAPLAERQDGVDVGLVVNGELIRWTTSFFRKVNLPRKN